MKTLRSLALRKAESNGTILSEDFKVSCIIDKLPSSWSDFARSLRHKQGELSMIQVISALRIEENYRSFLNAITPSKVNLVENQSKKQNNGHKHNYNKNNG